MDALGPGRIIWAVFPGRRGGGKLRPMVVASRCRDIVRDKTLFAVVCTTDFVADDLLPREIEIPSQEDGRCLSRLRHRTVASCDWTTTLPVEDVHDTAGSVSGAMLRDICQKADIPFPHER